MFVVTPGSFVIGFPNGYEVSVAFGPGNYCSNKQEKTLKACKGAGEHVRCLNAEVAVFLTGSNDALDIREYDFDSWSLQSDGKGLSWAKPETVAKLIALVAALPNREDWIDHA